ncbi:Variant surface glycoprotein [Trypanosoma congolense IL3000]|uniref:Variant surface glycoprotein n=1 Tax=Trypanosoma congolense (strain IL3000) TaxID=1068625 RepID=F9W7B7_TRYCI|nr:Variant surface glycoprotein [Trypanosoma congolense IL3000]
MCFSFLSIFLIIVGMWDTRMMVRAMLGVGFAMVLFMDDVRVYSYPDGTVFNDVEYKTLCEVFKASADLWNASRISEKIPNSALNGALTQALLGNIGNRHLSGIKESLPKYYTHHTLRHRGERCGGCKNTDKLYFPGSSITHDLMCLCTPGQDAEPFYGYYWFFYKENGFKLCGKGRAQMGVDLNHGWYVDKKKKGNNGLEKPWKTVVWGCFNSWKSNPGLESHNLTEKIVRLNATLQNFTSTLKKMGGHDKLGGFEEHNEADGSDERHIHVRYDNCKGPKKPWWKKLKETLDGKKPDDLLMSRPVDKPAGGAGETPDDGPVEEPSEEMEGEVGDMEVGGPTNTLATAAQDGNGTRMQEPTNSTEGSVIPLNATASGNSSHPRLEYLRSGSHINQPLLFPSAIFLT